MFRSLIGVFFCPRSKLRQLKGKQVLDFKSKDFIVQAEFRKIFWTLLYFAAAFKIKEKNYILRLIGVISNTHFMISIAPMYNCTYWSDRMNILNSAMPLMKQSISNRCKLHYCIFFSSGCGVRHTPGHGGKHRNIPHQHSSLILTGFRQVNRGGSFKETELSRYSWLRFGLALAGYRGLEVHDIPVFRAG